MRNFHFLYRKLKNLKISNWIFSIFLSHTCELCFCLLWSWWWRCLQKEGTTLLLADIFSTCYGWESIKPIKENSHMQPVNGARIDPKFVNNSELSDVTFRWVGSFCTWRHGHELWEKNTLFSCSHEFSSLCCFFSSFFKQFFIAIHRVEGKVFYGHKIVLVTASPRLQSLLSSKVSEGNGTPTVQINDIRYHIFEVSEHEWEI